MNTHSGCLIFALEIVYLKIVMCLSMVGKTCYQNQFHRMSGHPLVIELRIIDLMTCVVVKDCCGLDFLLDNVNFLAVNLIVSALIYIESVAWKKYEANTKM